MFALKVSLPKHPGLAVNNTAIEEAIPSAEEALPGRDERMDVPERHDVLDAPLEGPYPDETELALFGMGCFWGPEQLFWQRDGVYTTAVGYAGGRTPNPTYREVCSGKTGHAEVVRVVFRPDTIGYESLVRLFWENHDPTQGLRQGADVGSQYRSALYWYDENQRRIAMQSLEAYQQRLEEAGYGAITTELREAPDFYFAEPKHQQYLAKNPRGYCGSGGTGVECPSGLDVD